MLRRYRTAALLQAGTRCGIASSQWVYSGPDRHLRYRAGERGNRTVDFSYAGYAVGGVKLPNAPAVKMIAPVGGDNTPQIQAALNEVSARRADAGGIRGAVLKPRTYEVAGKLNTTGSGHGRDAGWVVGWNAFSAYQFEQPTGAMNWCIVPKGIYEILGHAVEPASLYLERWRERLGDKALAKIDFPITK
jgi:hypothetical protein